MAVARVPLRTFARLKLRILANSLRTSSRRVVMFVLSALVGGVLGLVGFAVLLSSGFSQDGQVLAAMIGSVIVVGWVALPLLFFGVDETVDPARFALLPLSKGRVIAGQVITAAIGIPAAATAFALLGLVFGSLRRGLPTALIALAGAVLTLLFGIVASRAVTSTFAMSLRSRRAKDFATIGIAVMAGSIGPLEAIAFNMVGTAHRDSAQHVVDVLGWTPIAAGFAAPYDIAAGRPAVAVTKLGVLVAAIVLAVLLWRATLESAMIGTQNTGPKRRSRPGDTRGSVSQLLPAVVRVPRPGPMTGIIGRELRYWMRDPRRRASLATMMIIFIAFPVIQRVVSDRRSAGIPIWVLTGFMGIMVGMLLINMFSYDGGAYGLHVLVNVKPRIEIAGRATAYLLTLVPVFIAATILLATVASDSRRIPVAIGTLLATTGASLGAGSALAVPAAYPLPETRNILAMNTGTGTERGLLSLVGLAITIALSIPALIAAHLYGWEHGYAYAIFGLVWGATWSVLGVFAGAKTLQRWRADRLLAQITPSV